MFVANLHIQNCSSERVAQAASGFIRDKAFVSPASESWVSVYDQASEQMRLGEVHRLAASLSAGLGAAVLGFTLTDEQLEYVLYDSGEIEDEFSSQPEEARRERLTGRPDVLASYCSADAAELGRALGIASPDPMAALKNQMRATMAQADPETFQATMRMAADQMAHLPKPMVEAMFKKTGLPVDNPIFAPFLNDPSGALKQLAENPLAMQMLTSQMQAMLGDDTPSPVQPDLPVQTRLLELASLLGLNARHVLLTFSTLVQGSRAADGGFTEVG